ncbi:ABC transporter permease [Mesorhizobium sp. B3-1-3]|uniref:ABC transporter permease n=1 Tax=unclassified Mesorhizobium TaxID=325217 RepID=UPI00112D74FC|nr:MULTISPECIES: ABC transporter permease [unclassified Mesorhizobium]TPI64835.1 ABC transporter permease [Mesorhizobium sp. B3-1-3]TPI69655.1 ABC transporter permease [Mesorhizobium sp. B3-1-8]
MTASTSTLYHPKISHFMETYGIVLIVLVMMAILAVIKPDVFLSAENLTNILKQNASLALLALGMLVVIVTGGIDLSVGSTMALAMVCIAMASRVGVPWPICLLIGPVVGLAVGWANGIGLTWLKLPHPFIMTLGTLNIGRGLTYLLTGGAPVSGLQPELRYLGVSYWGLGIFNPPAGLPVSLVVVAISAVLLWLFLNRTSTGRHIYAIGGNPHAARVSGVNVDRVLTAVYMICGFFAGLAGLLLVGRTGSGFPNAGIGIELDAVAAVIIGGASFFGGRGTVLGVLAGVLIMGLLRNGLNINNVSAFWQMILIGFVIIIAVYIDVVRRKAAIRT